MKPLRKTRRLSGYAFFLREQFAGCGVRVGTPEHRQLQRDLADQWKAFSCEEKNMFEVKAAQAQECRSSFRETILSQKDAPNSLLMLVVNLNLLCGYHFC